MFIKGGRVVVVTKLGHIKPLHKSPPRNAEAAMIAQREEQPEATTTAAERSQRAQRSAS